MKLSIKATGALAEPGGPLCLTFAPGRLENLTLFIKYYNSYNGHPGFHRFRSLGSLQFFFEQSLVKVKILSCALQ